MLPKWCLDDDKKWIKEQLSVLPYENALQACRGYDQVFCDAYNGEPAQHRKEQAGRTAANTRLRKYVERVTQQA